MAGKNTKGAKAAPAKKATVVTAADTTAAPVDTALSTAEQSTARPTVKAFDPNQIVTVRNGFQGRLVYKSPKTGERYVWDGFGAEQDMEVSELRAARSSAKKYFINNWFMFDDPEIVEYLGMTQYYKFALDIDGFDSLFDKSPEDINKIIARLSNGQKKSVAYRAKQMIATGGIDSNRVIRALENALGVELIER